MEQYSIKNNVYSILQNRPKHFVIYKDNLLCSSGYQNIFDAREALFRLVKNNLHNQQAQLLTEMKANDSWLEKLEGNDWCKILNFKIS